MLQSNPVVSFLTTLPSLLTTFWKLAGSAIMQTLLRIWPARSMKVADRGLREGILYSLMTADNYFQ